MEKRICRIEGKGRKIKGFVLMHFIGKHRTPRPVSWARTFGQVKRGKGMPLGGSHAPLADFALIFLDSLGRSRPLHGFTFCLFGSDGYCRFGGDHALAELQKSGGYAVSTPAKALEKMAAA